jgi:transposase-like protein
MAPAEAPPSIPHCPFADCDSHADTGTWRFKRKGFYQRAAEPQRIQRYFCQHCRRSFSSQTFSVSYWLRRPELLRPVFFRIGNGCSALRQAAFELGVSYSTVQRLGERLGRHCLLFHEKLRPKACPAERLVLDGFVSFEHSQYWPFEVNLLVGHSHYVYGFQDAERRRSGRMTPYQQKKRERLEQAFGRPRPDANRESVQELLERQLPPGSKVALSTDEHADYPRAIKRLSGGRTIDHDTTSSKARRTTQNPLFPVNRADLLIRHEGANHKRETIAFSKRRQGAMWRLAIWQVIRNYMKPTKTKKGDPPPGATVGAIASRLSYEDVVSERLLPWQFKLEGWLERCYYGRIPTRALGECREHRLRYAS